MNEPIITTEAVEAAARAWFLIDESRYGGDADWPEWDSDENADARESYRDDAKALLSAAAAHVGTGQAEADLRARISALADKWDEIAKRASNRHDWKGSEIREWCADDLRALLHRPAAEGDNDA